jgi:CubicO group peptidase (beta-lactamase class C family)
MLLKRLFLLVLLITTLAGSARSQRIQRLDHTHISADSLTRRIESLMAMAQVQGLAVSVFNQGKPVYEKTFGYKRLDTKEPLHPNTVFYGASLSKAVFSVLVLKLIEEGVIDLDTPLQKYLPRPIWTYGPGKSWNQDYTNLKDDSLYAQITARMCLSHTSGFPNWRWDEPDQKLRVDFRPGARYSYSGEGLCYLQFVLEQRTGKTLEELMREKLYQPLHMTQTSYTWQPRFETNYCFGHSATGQVFPKDKDNAPRSASTLETTLQDYSRFMAGVLQQKILRPSSYDAMFSPQVRLRTVHQMGKNAWRDTTSAYDAINLSYGLGWGYLMTPYGRGAFKEGHSDEGWQHYSIVFPDQKIGIVIMSNSNNAEKIFKELLEVAIADTYTPWAWEGYIPYNYAAKK